MKISLEQAVKYNEQLFDMLADYCGKDKKTVLKDCARDNWLTANEALEYGIIDGVVSNKTKG
jgi:ATP-dependent Clp protease protease subunit